MRKIFIGLILTIAVVGFCSTVSAAELPTAPIWPVGGNNLDLLVKAGDKQEENNWHFQWLNGSMKDTFIVFDSLGNTSFIPLTNYSLSTHKHTAAADLTDIATFVFPLSKHAEEAENAKEATHSKSADSAHKADNGFVGTVVTTTPKEGNIMAYVNGQWVPCDSDVPAGGLKGQTLTKSSDKDYDLLWATSTIPPAPDKANMVLVVNEKKQVEWLSIDDVFLNPLKEAKAFYQAFAYTLVGVNVVLIITMAVFYFTRPKPQ